LPCCFSFEDETGREVGREGKEKVKGGVLKVISTALTTLVLVQ
jgi:hypothetical protein